MSESKHHKPASPASTGKDGTTFTRRSVLSAAAAATAAATIGGDVPAFAQGSDAAADLNTFVTLSSALTGIAAGKLKPFADSLDLSRDFFDWIGDWSTKRQSAAFATLLQVTRSMALQAGADRIIKQPDVDRLVNAIEQRGDEPKYLARSIVLMWYLGSWYEPGDLKKLPAKAPSFIGHSVISPKAYTQGWVWRVAQAHPMGYSDLQFGYWTREPPPPLLSDFIGTRQAKTRPTPPKGG
jgi:hypothetical protein